MLSSFYFLQTRLAVATSLYNNTVFVQGAADIGELADAGITELQMLGNPRLWSLCSVTPPSNCRDESFAFPMATGASVQVLPQLQVLTVTLVMILAAFCGFL